MHISQHRSVYIYQSRSFLCQSRRFPCKILYRFLRQNSCCNQAHPRRRLAWLGSKRIFAIRFATCRIIRDPPASGSFLMIFHNLYHMWAWLTYDTSKSPPTAYCSAQLKQETCLTRLKKAAARVSFLWLLHSHKLLLSSIVFEKCIMQKSPGFSSGTPHFQNYTKANIRDLHSIKQALSLQALQEKQILLHH